MLAAAELERMEVKVDSRVKLQLRIITAVRHQPAGEVIGEALQLLIAGMPDDLRETLEALP